MARYGEIKKRFVELPQVEKFIAALPLLVKQEYEGVIRRLETNGHLSTPYGEKIAGENLFVIRVIQTDNIRVFYAYGKNDTVYGLRAYFKRTAKIPNYELANARRLLRGLQKQGLI